MNKAIIGKKLGMSQIFAPDGTFIPVTVILAGPCPVVQKKTKEKDGYDSVQIAFGEIRSALVNKPVTGHYKKANMQPMRELREFRLEDCSAYEVGNEIKADIFAEGEKVDVTGFTKGHGFSGVIKRWGQRRLKETHGVGPVHREVGSMGANSTPSRVLKGKKLPGQYGNEQVTVLNLTVVKVDKERNLLLVKGAVPGSSGSIVTIRNAVKA